MSRELLVSAMKAQGTALAQALQDGADDMTSTELVASKAYIPLFAESIKVMNMFVRPLGFVVKTAQGNVCRLLQKYDSTIYTDEPELLPAQWGFKWTQDPEQATEFVALSTSPYMIGDCCVGSDGVTYRSTIDNNVFDPVTSPSYWTVAGQVYY